MAQSKDEERRGIQHVIDGYPPVRVEGGRMMPEEGVEIIGKNGPEKPIQEKGVQIVDPRHGAS